MTMQNKNVPSLRFPEFGDQWNEIGLNKFLIPTFREIEKPTEPYLAIGVRSHCKGTFQKPDSEPEKIAMDKLFVVKENDLIVNITFAWEGAIAIVKKEDEGGLVSHRFPTYTFDESVSSHTFFQYVFTQKKFRTILELISPGGAGRNRVLSKKDFLKIKVNLPSLPEQRKIAAFLTAVDEKIRHLTTKKALLERYKRGVMKKIFDQEIRFKDDNGNDFADWEEKRLGEISQNVMYGLNSSAIAFDGINKYIRITDIDESTRKFSPKPLTSPDGNLESKYKLKEGDILFTRTGASVGKSYLYDKSDGNLFFAGFLIRFSIVHANPFFVYLQTLMESYEKWVQMMSKRSGQPGLNAEEYKSLKIKLPSIEEQNKIANFLSAIDDKINLVNQQLEKTQIFKKGLLQLMFV